MTGSAGGCGHSTVLYTDAHASVCRTILLLVSCRYALYDIGRRGTSDLVPPRFPCLDAGWVMSLSPGSALRLLFQPPSILIFSPAIKSHGTEASSCNQDLISRDPCLAALSRSRSHSIASPTANFGIHRRCPAYSQLHEQQRGVMQQVVVCIVSILMY